MANVLKVLVLCAVFTQGTAVLAARVVFVTDGTKRYTVSSDKGRCIPSALQRNSPAKCPYKKGGKLVVSSGSLRCTFSMQNTIEVYNAIPFCRRLNPTLTMQNGIYTVTIK